MFDDIDFNEGLMFPKQSSENNNTFLIKTDCSFKEIGDRVIINDHTNMTYLNGASILELEVKKITNVKYYIVIENNQNFINVNNIFLDLVIANPNTKDRYRINSYQVKHF